MKKGLILLISILFLSCSKSEPDDSFETELNDIFSSYFPLDEPGGAVLVMKGEQILFEKGYGLADLQTEELITPKTIFNTGSISKTFVSNGILLLQEHGLLSIEDNILTHFPDFKNKELARKIRLINLLTHTSGLPDLRGVSDSLTYYLTADDAQNFAPIKENQTLHFEPGEQFEYSNPAYNGLALVIENITNERWQKFIEKEIFIPSAMENSKITDGSFPESGVSHAYIKENNGFQEYDFGEYPTFNAAGNGGVWSTVQDLAKYKIALKNGTFLNKKIISESMQSYNFSNWKDTVNIQNGYSWFINQTDSIEYVGHTGSQGGFISDFLITKENDITYILLCNTPKPILEMRKKVFATFRNHFWQQY